MMKKISMSGFIATTLMCYLSVAVNAFNPDFYCAQSCNDSGVCSGSGGVYSGQCFSDNLCYCYCANAVQQFYVASGQECVEPSAATAACDSACASKSNSLNAWCADSTSTYSCRCGNGEDVRTTTSCTPDTDQAQCTSLCNSYCNTEYPTKGFWYSKCQYNGGNNRCACFCDAPSSSSDGDVQSNQYCGQDADGLEPPVEGLLYDIQDLYLSVLGDFVCFSPETTVVVGDNTIRKIKDVVVGDRVLTKNGQYETVYAIDHKDHHTPVNFVQIYHEQHEQPLEITKNHMVFLIKSEQSIATAAELVKVGDKLQTLSGPSTVTNIATVVRKGMYSPLTASGSIVVDHGVVASTFSSYKLQNDQWTNQWMMEKLLKPYEVFCTGIKNSLNWCEATGMSKSEEKTIVSRWAASFYGSWLHQHEAIRTIAYIMLVTMTTLFTILYQNYAILFMLSMAVTKAISSLSKKV